MNYFNKILVVIGLMLSNYAVADVAVIVNLENGDTIDANLIKKIYLGKAKVFPNGTKVKVYTLSSNQEDTKYFRQKALKKSNSQFKSYWSKLAFTGKGTPATKLDTAADIISAIKKDPKAIGFVNVKDVSSDVKVVKNY